MASAAASGVLVPAAAPASAVKPALRRNARRFSPCRFDMSIPPRAEYYTILRFLRFLGFLKFLGLVPAVPIVPDVPGVLPSNHRNVRNPRNFRNPARNLLARKFLDDERRLHALTRANGLG